MTALRTVLWPISVAKLTAAGLSRSADSAAPTSSADPPQLPATMVVTPMRTKFAAAGRLAEVVGVRVDVDEPGRDDQAGRVDDLLAACDCGIRPIAAIRPSLIATSVTTPARPVPSITVPPAITRS